MHPGYATLRDMGVKTLEVWKLEGLNPVSNFMESYGLSRMQVMPVLADDRF